jgi:hypothetical protein
MKRQAEANKFENRKKQHQIPKPEPPWPGGDPDNFVGVIDNTTFGVLNGKSFVVGENKAFDHALWAEANAMYFMAVAQRLAWFAEVRKAEAAINAACAVARKGEHEIQET